MDFASGMKNAEYTLNGSTNKRKGFQTHCSSAGGYGTFLYNKVSPASELETPLVVSVDQNLYVMQEASITVHYSGAASTAQLSFFYDTITSQYRFQLNDGGVIVLDFGCGLGFDEASIKTFNDLLTAINATPNFSATNTGSISTPAAFIKIVRAWDLGATSGADWVGIAQYWSQVNSTVSNPFSAYLAKKNTAAFENVSGTVLNNVLYLTNGYTDVFKFDGQTFYRAGLPTPASIATALGGAGAITGNNYYHQAQYHQEDAAGQIFEGNLQIVTTGLNPAAQSMNITVANILAGSGFNTNCAIVAGAQVAVNTLTVDDGSGGTHTMKVGDTAYFHDSVSAAYITRAVTAITSTTITVDGAAVTVADNAVISNNLRINIWRNKTSAITPSSFYLVAELPNNSFSATQVYNDNLTDAQLGAILIAPISDRSPPPRGKYVSQHQGELVIAGNLGNQNRIYWSVDSPEYFPNNTNQIDAETQSGDVIKGIGPSGTVFGILTKQTSHILSGTLGDNSIRMELKANDIGCEAHASIVQIKGIMCWWSSRGPYAMVNGQIPVPIGTTEDSSGNKVGRIEPVMKQDGVPTSQIWRTQRITAINWIENKKAIWFLPAENQPLASDWYPNSNSALFVYDYDQDAWLEWNTINLAGGAVVSGSEFYFQERAFSSYSSSVRKNLYRMHNLNDAWDYEDNNRPIAWEYDMGWETNGEPSVLNRFIEVKVFALEEVPNNVFTIQVDQEMNFQKDASVATFDIAFEGSGYGTTEYGTNPYGDSLEGYFRHELKRERSRSMRLRFSNVADQTNCLFTGLEYMISAPYRKEFKV